MHHRMVGFFVYIQEKNQLWDLFPSRASTMKRSGRVLVCVLFVFLFGLPLRVDTALDTDDLDRKLFLLSKVIDYIYQRPEQMNVDATFGITITEANIVATVSHANVRYLGGKYIEALIDLLHVCEATRTHLMRTVVPENDNVRLLFEELNKLEYWIRPIFWSRGALGRKPNPSPGLTHQSVVNLTMQGTPQEGESDECLSEIVRNKLRGDCRIPDDCIATLKREDNSRGYPLTHRLLIIQVARALGCPETSKTFFSTLPLDYCSSIFQDMIDIEAADFPSNSRDLMSEQMLLCGSEGFLEFLDKHYENLLLSWPHSSGCFSAFGFIQEHRIYPRKSQKTDFGCDSHATGLAAATLSLFVRKDIETAYGNI